MLVHHWGGSQRTLTGHARFLHQLGYATVTMSLQLSFLKALLTGCLIRSFVARQISEVLLRVEGPVVIYSLSSLGSSAFQAVSKKTELKVQGFICDGGPFNHFYTCSENLLRTWYKVPRGLSHFLAIWAPFFWDLFFTRRQRQELESLPDGFPILSLRGEDDPLVSPEAIDAYFSKASQIHLRKKVFPGGKHLDALSVFPDEYRQSVSEFLSSIAQN